MQNARPRRPVRAAAQRTSKIDFSRCDVCPLCADALCAERMHAGCVHVQLSRCRHGMPCMPISLTKCWHTCVLTLVCQMIVSSFRPRLADKHLGEVQEVLQPRCAWRKSFRAHRSCDQAFRWHGASELSCHLPHALRVSCPSARGSSSAPQDASASRYMCLQAQQPCFLHWNGALAILPNDECGLQTAPPDEQVIAAFLLAMRKKHQKQVGANNAAAQPLQKRQRR